MTESATRVEDGPLEHQGREAIPAIARQLRAIDTCMLATRGSDGELHARLMSNNGQVEWDGSSWFFAPRDGRLVSEIEGGSAVVTTYRASDRFAWVALSGHAELIDDVDAKRRNWLPELDRWFPNGPEDPGVALIRVQATQAQWWTEEGDGIADLS